ncbi:hypothetical protein AB1K80_12230 [Bacillus sp. 179-C3.3 HS]
MAFYDSEDVILLTSSYLKAEGTVTNVKGRVTLKVATYPICVLAANATFSPAEEK